MRGKVAISVELRAKTVLFHSWRGQYGDSRQLRYRISKSAKPNDGADQLSLLVSDAVSSRIFIAVGGLFREEVHCLLPRNDVKERSSTCSGTQRREFYWSPRCCLSRPRRLITAQLIPVCEL